jgi:hypothetical protein
MRRIIILLEVALVLALTAAVPAAQPPKKPPGTLFLMTPTPAVYAAEPAIEAVLLLTSKQRNPLQQAHEEIFNTAELKQLRQSASDKSLSAKDHKSADKALGLALSTADTKYHKRVDEILTAKQKATIKNVNDAYHEAQKQVPDLFDITKIKTMTKEERAKLSASFKVIFAQRLQSILTAEQKTALATAKAK